MITQYYGFMIFFFTCKREVLGSNLLNGKFDVKLGCSLYDLTEFFPRFSIKYIIVLKKIYMTTQKLFWPYFMFVLLKRDRKKFRFIALKTLNPFFYVSKIDFISLLRNMSHFKSGSFHEY